MTVTLQTASAVLDSDWSIAHEVGNLKRGRVCLDPVSITELRTRATLAEHAHELFSRWDNCQIDNKCNLIE